ncbi:hypothetical protein QA600_18525 [Natronococcus sp. A-GB1]|uniref:hypothetical protein n=1 Tax=Natronococcus sp. A-GB1 TaxID=3037648 RepID=UPI00241F8BB3|nr:hypothetical protein [Natronococcus sp. A-GB1]MDG5761329.1 hypothetical protein [Natronococcus sp. A-GB1]
MWSKISFSSSRYARPGKIPVWIYVVSGVILVAVIGLGQVIQDIPVENIRAFLTTLTGIQGGVLALVLTILVVGIQFISWLSSPWLATILLQARIFHFTIGVFIASVSINLGLLLVTPAESAQWMTSSVLLSAGLTLVGFVSLYGLTVFVFEQSTPEGAIDTFQSSMSPLRYVDLAEDESSPHPLYPLYTAIVTAVSRKDWETARRGVDSFSQILLDTLAARKEDGELSDLGSDMDATVFMAPVREYVPFLALQAFGAEEYDLGESLLLVNVRFGEVVAKMLWSDSDISGQLFKYAVFGLSDFARRSPATDNGAIGFELAMMGSGRLFREDALVILAAGMQYPGSAIGETFLGGETNERHVNGAIAYQRDVIRHQEVILGACSSTDEVDIDWSLLKDSRGEETPATIRNYLQGIRVCRAILMETTAAIISSEISPEKENRFSVSQELSDIWHWTCITAVREGVPEYATDLAIAAIHASFAVSRQEGRADWQVAATELENETVERPWIANLASISQESDEVLSTAFDKIEQKLEQTSRGETDDPFHYPFQPDAWHDSILEPEPLLSWIETDLVTDYEGWIPEFRAAVETEQERLSQDNTMI